MAQSADSTGSVSIPAASPPEPAGGGLVTASSPSGTVTDTFTSLAVFYGPTTGEPGDPALITLTGFGANETIKASFDAGPVSQTFAADGNGSLSANVHMYGSTTGSLPSYLTLTITQGTGTVSFGSSCTNFSAGTQIYSGTLSNFSSTYTNYSTGLSLTNQSSSSTWASSDYKVYKFVLSLNDDNSAQNCDTSSLTPGTIVHEAELKLSGAGAV